MDRRLHQPPAVARVVIAGLAEGARNDDRKRKDVFSPPGITKFSYLWWGVLMSRYCSFQWGEGPHEPRLDVHPKRGLGMLGIRPRLPSFRVFSGLNCSFKVYGALVKDDFQVDFSPAR